MRTTTRTVAEILSETIVRNAFVVKCVVFSYRFSERIIANGVKVLVGRIPKRSSSAPLIRFSFLQSARRGVT